MSTAAVAGTRRFDDTQRQLLLQLAQAAVQYGLNHHRPPPVDITQYPAPLREPGACFVTLNRNGALRGCIGSLEARRPLVEDIAANAHAAAFSDPRFTPLTTDELPGLEFHISVLSPARPMQFTSEADLLRQIQPGIDGLILEDGRHRGTFLPSVWESLPRVQDFWQHLKLKAGLAPDHWSATLQVSRYTTESF